MRMAKLLEVKQSVKLTMKTGADGGGGGLQPPPYA